jgi:hypothetical protein
VELLAGADRVLGSGGKPVAARLVSGEQIAIVRVEGHKLVTLCPRSPGAKPVKVNSPRTFTYQAYIVNASTGSRAGSSFHQSNKVTVEWKKLTITPQLLGDGVRAGTGTDFSQVMGAPSTVKWSLPDGVGTAWATLNLTWIDSASPDPCKGQKKGPCRFTKTCTFNGTSCDVPAGASPAEMAPAFPDSKNYPPQPFKRMLRVQVRDAAGKVVLTDPHQYTIEYRPWLVALKATNTTTEKESTSSIVLDSGSQDL